MQTAPPSGSATHAMAAGQGAPLSEAESTGSVPLSTTASGAPLRLAGADGATAHAST